MAEQCFSYKELISHGWEMTKKYRGIIAFVCMIYIGLQFFGGVLSNFAGSRVEERSVRQLYKDPGQGKKLYGHLQEGGYIDHRGEVLPKLQQLTNPQGLQLSTDFEGDRARIYDLLNKHRYRLPFPKPLYFVFSIALWVINILISVGFVKIWLMISRDEEPEIGELFSNAQYMVPYLLGGICLALVVMGGLILLIVPGIIFMISFQFWYYLIVDKGLGPIEAIKRSGAITKGSRWRLAVLGGILLLLNLGGLLCLIVGVAVTMSITSIAMARAYDLLEAAYESQVSQI